jgi:hypothetical protein
LRGSDSVQKQESSRLVLVAERIGSLAYEFNKNEITFYLFYESVQGLRNKTSLRNLWQGNCVNQGGGLGEGAQQPKPLHIYFN